MTYKLLTEVGHGYANTREDLPSDPVLRGLSAELKTQLKLLQEYRVPVAPPMGFVKGLAAAHEQKARTESARIYEEQAIRTRNKLRSLGCATDEEGNVTWPADKHVVAYDYSLQAQGLTRAYIDAGLLRDASGNRVDTGAWNTAQQANAAMYVMSAEGHFHYGKMVVHGRHHSSLLAGIRVACAGEFKATDGRITFLSNDSGHYNPTIKHFLQVLHQLQKQGVFLDAVRVNYVYEDAHGNIRDEPHATVGAFMTAHGLDNESYDANNLLEAYRHLLTPASLDSKDWEFRDSPRPGVYSKLTGLMIPHRDVRHYFLGSGAKVVQSGAGR